MAVIDLDKEKEDTITVKINGVDYTSRVISKKVFKQFLAIQQETVKMAENEDEEGLNSLQKQFALLFGGKPEDYEELGMGKMKQAVSLALKTVSLDTVPVSEKKSD